MRKTTFLALIAFATICTLAPAKLYWDAPAGQGTSTVGPGGDYANFTTAAADFNTTAPTGNWTLEITGSFTQPNNVAFGQTTGAFTFTIKPAAAVTATVTFTDPSDNAGWSGGLIIGTNQLLNTDDYMLQTTTVIDGSNNGTTSRDLTFVFPATFSNNLGATVGGGFPVGIHVAASKDCVLKNFKVQFLVDNAIMTATRSVYAVRVGARHTATTAVPASRANLDLFPDNTLLQNLDIYAIGARQAHGVGFTGSGTMAGAQKAIQNSTIEDCTIVGQTRGVLFNFNGSFTVRRNTIRCHQNDAGGGLTGSAVIHANANAQGGWTSYIYNNMFDEIYSATNSGGVTGLDLGGAPAAAGTKYVVYNNVLKGFQLTNPTAADLTYRAVTSASSYSNYEFFNNTVLMPYMSNVNGTTTNKVAVFCNTGTNAANNFTIQNNIIVNSQTAGTSCIIYKRNGDVTAPTVNNNDYITPLTTSGNFAKVGATPTNYTYAAWQAIPRDAASITLDPTSLMANDGYHFKKSAVTTPYQIGATGGNIPVVDMDGQAQTATPTVGADVPGGNYVVIASDHGSVPPVGYNYAAVGSSFTASAPDVTAGTTKYVATGYVGVGSAPTGSGNSVTFNADNDSTLTWTWKTQYQVATAVAPPAGGSITGVTNGAFYDSASVQAPQAVANGGWTFSGWSGDLTGTTNPESLTIDAAKSITANFVNADIYCSSTLACGTAMFGTSVTLSLTIQNLGDTDLVISALNITGSDASVYDCPSASLPITIVGGGSYALAVRFYPPVTTTYNNATLVITSNDADEPTTNVALTGEGVGGPPLAVNDWRMF